MSSITYSLFLPTFCFSTTTFICVQEYNSKARLHLYLSLSRMLRQQNAFQQIVIFITINISSDEENVYYKCLL